MPLCTLLQLCLLLCIQQVLGVNVRLAGGRTSNEGRLEVRKSVDEQWGTVCDDQFDEKDASVVCRMLGFVNTENSLKVAPSVYGGGSGLILLDELGCFGNETSLSECSSSSWGESDCDHSEDIGVSCQTPVKLVDGPSPHSGRVEIKRNGTWESVCFDTFNENVGKVICRMLAFSTGRVAITKAVPLASVSRTLFNCTGTEKDVSLCSTAEGDCPSGMDASVNCQTEIRLTDGPHNQSGRVEIFFQNEWGTVCDDSFDDNTASVICRMLGFNPKGARARGRAAYGKGNGRVLIDELRCIGSETDIAECKSNLWGSHTNCGHEEDAAVECGTEIRLINGPTSFSGRLEIKSRNSWNTMCDDTFDNKTARVVCNMLGFERGNITIHTNAFYGRGSNEVSNYNLECAGNETDIVDCKHTVAGRTCTHARDVGINCYSITPIRLQGGPTSFSGRVEVYMQQQSAWMGICYKDFTVEDAKVLCRMLGKPNMNTSFHNATGLYDYVIRGNGVSSMNCTGTEKDITDCRSGQRWSETFCNYPDYVGINCEPVTNVRLVDGPSQRAGRVEIQYNGTWGTICSDAFDTNDSSVICTMLGFTKESFLLNPEDYRHSNATKIISNVECKGGENDISDCRANSWMSENCNTGIDVGIACNSTVRLADGDNTRTGRVEVFFSGKWATICDEGFDVNAANVICRMVGFRFWNASVLPGSPFGKGHEAIINSIDCNGTEPDLASCTSSPWKNLTCRTNEVATVDCHVQHSNLRLVDGDTLYSGKVQVFHHGKWGTVCYDGFTKANAKIICLTLGYNFTSDVTFTYVYWYNTVMISNLACTGNETDISECKSDDWDTGKGNCTNNQSVKVNCLTSIKLLGGRTKAMGRVEVQHENSFGTICRKDFIKENIPVLCSMLGFNYTQTYEIVDNTFISESVIGPVIIQNLTCNGTETDIQQCMSSPWKVSHSCSKEHTAAINCNTPVHLIDGPNWRSGLIEINLNGNLKNICYSDNVTSKAVGKVVCRMLGLSTRNITTYPVQGPADVHVNCSGDEEDISICYVKTSPCHNSKVLGLKCDTGIKLVYGRTKYMGGVSVFIHDRWETVTKVQNEEAAKVVCRMLGYHFSGYNDIQTSTDLRNRVYLPYNIITKLICDGNETDVLDCKRSEWNIERGYSYLDNGVNCQTPLRLSNGSKYQFGRVELRENKIWHTICSDGFTLENAYVMCRMLGHQHVRNTTSFTSVMDTSGHILTGNLQCTGTEADVSQCQNSWTNTSTCRNSAVVHLDCRSSIRLVGGPTKFKGRIEVSYEGAWGQMCYSWTSYNPKVMCRILGYNYHSAAYHSGTLYQNIPVQRDSFTITNLACVGTEDDITECSSDVWKTGSCPNRRPMEIECNSGMSLIYGSNRYIGSVRVGYNDDYRIICGDGFGLPEADVVCRMIGIETNRNATIYYGNKFSYQYYNVITGLKCIGNETDLQECKSSSWSSSTSNCSKNNHAVSVNCRPVTPVRLKGNDNSSGIVEINFEGYWGTIHVSSMSNGFSNKDANVICGMLGFKTGRSSSPKYVSNSNAIIRNLNCKGTEKDISECSSAGWITSSFSSDNNLRAVVQCTDKRVRLEKGVNDYQGAVQFQYIGLWGTICDRNFDMSDGKVVCKQIGITSGHPVLYNTTHFGDVSSSLIVDDLKCNGAEEDLDECASYPWTANNFSCSRSHRSVGINCRPKTPIKLVNGSNSYTGRVEVEYKGSYGTVCDRNFDENDAKVVCRMLGYSPLSVMYHKHAYYGLGSNKITISHLQCEGSELDISECRAGYRWDSPYPYCTHENDVSVQCDTPVRLRGGWTLYDGLVEVWINGSWKSVCYEGFTKQDAQTVCRITGQNWKNHRAQNVTLHQGKFYGIDSISEIGRFGCNGMENDLYECGYSKWTTENKSCAAENSVAVNCHPTTFVRLMKEMEEIEVPVYKNHSITGRVEVFYENEWGSICDDQFDDSDAQVLCNMLGIPYGKVHREKNNGKSIGNILVDDLECLGTEKDVSECKAREWGTHNCRHDEDVAITCEYKTDPCKAKASVRLPNLELRYVNVNTTRLPKAINDSRLPYRWYNVGNNTMPVKPPPMESCGTHLPIYSTSKYEALPPDASATIKATQVGERRETYEIEMKNCFGEFFVYRLRPTNNDASGYCFGIGSKELAPSFVLKSVSAIVHHDEKSVSYICKFEPSRDDLYYQVKWRIEGNSQLLLTKQYYKYAERDALSLTEQDFEDNDISLGVNISCAVRAFASPDGQPGLLSDFSKPSFFGIKILTPTISLQMGETKSIELLNSVPIICHSDNETLNQILQSTCHIRLEHTTPDYNTCEHAPTFKDGCDTKLTNTSLSQITRINISTAETGQYGVAGHFKIYLSAEPKLFPLKLILWRRVYKLPVINVEVLPETDKRWRGSVCSARNDPHMYTFDQKMYEHHENGGEYILYRNKDFENVEVQHKITSCTGDSSTAKCNCGVAVKAGRDVFVINVCGDLIDIGHKKCGDEVLTVKKDNDFTYTIYLPYGTAVRARIDNQPYSGPEGGKVLDISILPSVHDKEGKSAGLCGTLNSNQNDDFKHKDDRIGTVNKTQFIESWKVLENESLFTENIENLVLQPWVFPLCTCKRSVDGSPYTCQRSSSDCTPGMRTGQHSCGAISSRRSVRSVTRRPSIPLIRRTRHYTSDHKVVKREISENWNKAKAKAHCTEYFSKAKTFDLCKGVPSTHTNVSLENCILDILLTNNSGWTALSKQSMQDTCKTAIHRNASVRQEVIEKAKNATKEAESGSNIGTTVMPPEEINEIENLERDIQTINEIACLNDCSGKGNCSNGVCVCQQGYGASDCSLEINKPPGLGAILHNGLCDEKDESCTHIYVFGGIFVGTNLTCRLQKFNMRPNETRELEQTPLTVKGTAETLVEALCPVGQQPVSRKRRSSEPEYLPHDFVHGYQVSVSNDGSNFSNRTLDVYIFDSTCQTYTNDSIGMKFNLKAGYCHIEGKCVKNGSLSLMQTVICDTTVNKFNWTYVPTTTTTSTTTTTESSNGFTEKDPNSIISNIVKSKPDQHVFHIELKIDISIESEDNLNSTKTYQKYKNETKASLEGYYLKKLGLGLTEVVIISLRQGSLLVKHAVIVKNEEFVVKALSVAIADLSNGAKLELFGKDYGVINVKIDNNKVGMETDHLKEFFLCESYMALHPCQETERCVLEKETPVCRKTTQDSKTDQGNTSMFTIISSTVGAVLVIIIVALIAVICCKRKRNKTRFGEHRSTTEENQYHDINATEMRAIPKAKLYYGSKQSLGLDSPVYSHEQDQGGESMSARPGATSRSDSGSRCKADDGYIYYFGKK